MELIANTILGIFLVIFGFWLVIYLRDKETKILELTAANKVLSEKCENQAKEISDKDSVIKLHSSNPPRSYDTHTEL